MEYNVIAPLSMVPQTIGCYDNWLSVTSFSATESTKLVAWKNIGSSKILRFYRNTQS